MNNSPAVVMTCFARSGGTVLNQCIGSMPGIVMLSEVNPLGGGWSEAEGTKSRTTVQEQARHWYGIPVRAPSFKYGMVELASICEQTNRRLVVRDWSFINFIPHYYNGYNPPGRLLTLETISEDLAVKPFAFVRDAIDVWISRGTPPPDEFFPHYLRYVRAVLDTGQPVFRYEDFCTSPGAVLRAICSETGIDYDAGWKEYATYTNVNGDVQTPGGSRGMRQNAIRPLPRQPIPEHKIDALHRSAEMMEANRLLSYPESFYPENPGDSRVLQSAPKAPVDDLRSDGAKTSDRARTAATERMRRVLAAAAFTGEADSTNPRGDHENRAARTHFQAMTENRNDKTTVHSRSRRSTPDSGALLSLVPGHYDAPYSQDAGSLLRRELGAITPREGSRTLPRSTEETAADKAVSAGHAEKSLSAQIQPAAPPPTDELDLSLIRRAMPELKQASESLPLDEIHNFNQRERDRWVAAMASSVPAGSRVLDIGAGTCPYRHLFAHCDYRTHDFKQYEGEKLGGTSDYGEIDYVSDVVDIPVPDASFDVLLCTEVFEHVPEPIRALEEMARIVKPGGRLLITAPLGSGLHQLPYHFYGGYTPYWYEHFASQFGLEIREVTPNGGFFRLLAQECNRFAWMYRQNAHLQGANRSEIFTFFSDVLPRYLFGLEERHLVDQFTVGYHVHMAKPAQKPTERHDHEEDSLGAESASDARVDAAEATGAKAGPLDNSVPADGPQPSSAYALDEPNHTAGHDDDISIEEMRDSLLDALSRGGRATDNLTLLAQAALEVGDLDTARRCLESTLIIDDSHVGARSMLRQISTQSDL